MFYSLRLDLFRNFKNLLVALIVVMLIGDFCVNAKVLCADKGYKSCANTVSERDLRVLIPVRKQRAIFLSFASNRRSVAQPCRWKLCGAYNYQGAGSKRRL